MKTVEHKPKNGVCTFSSCQKQSPEKGGAFCIPWKLPLCRAPTKLNKQYYNCKTYAIML